MMVPVDISAKCLKWFSFGVSATSPGGIWKYVEAFSVLTVTAATRQSLRFLDAP